MLIRTLIGAVLGAALATSAQAQSLDGTYSGTRTITAECQATLDVNGRLVAKRSLPGFIGNNPNDAMQIGADLGSPVVEPAPPNFSGWIERVRLFRGEWKP